MIAVKIILRQSYSKHDTPTQLIFFYPFNAKIDPKISVVVVLVLLYLFFYSLENLTFPNAARVFFLTPKELTVYV